MKYCVVMGWYKYFFGIFFYGAKTNCILFDAVNEHWVDRCNDESMLRSESSTKIEKNRKGDEICWFIGPRWTSAMFNATYIVQRPSLLQISTIVPLSFLPFCVVVVGRFNFYTRRILVRSTFYDILFTIFFFFSNFVRCLLICQERDIVLCFVHSIGNSLNGTGVLFSFLFFCSLMEKYGKTKRVVKHWSGNCQEIFWKAPKCAILCNFLGCICRFIICQSLNIG